MGKSKNSKTQKVAPEKPKQKSYPKVLSHECEQCQTKCVSGIKYLEQMKQGVGKAFKGVVCRK